MSNFFKFWGKGGVCKNHVILPASHHISETVQNTITVLITDRNLNTTIRFVQRSTGLVDLEGRIKVIFLFSM